MAIRSARVGSFIETTWIKNGSREYQLKAGLMVRDTYLIVLSSIFSQDSVLKFLKSIPDQVTVIYEGPWSVNYWHDNEYDKKEPRNKLVAFELVDPSVKSKV